MISWKLASSAKAEGEMSGRSMCWVPVNEAWVNPFASGQEARLKYFFIVGDYFYIAGKDSVSNGLQTCLPADRKPLFNCE